MVFSSIVFLFYFLPITLFLLILVRFLGGSGNFKVQNFVLLVMSLFFYSWGEPVYVFLMIGSVFANFLFGKAIGSSSEKEKRKAFLTLAIVFNISTLLVFKYAGMFIVLINDLIPYQQSLIPVPEIRLPIGISFFTFQAMSYLFDVYKNEVPVQRKVLNLALYISFFPQLIAGPIVRYHDINEQLEKRTINKEGVYFGLIRFIIGLAKKVLIANVVAEAADEIFAMGANELTAPLAWLGIICYTLQIYFDFSGYSDMAIGLGRIFGFKFLENFNYPYIAKGIQDFWRRWHISLTTWFRDYLFLPVAYSTSRKLPKYSYFGLRADKVIYLIATTITFFLCGLWHGATWTYVAWGLYHGFFLIVERLFLGRYLKKTPAIINYIYTILIVMVGWVLFRTENFGDSVIYLKAMIGLGASENIIIWKFLEDFKLVFIILIAIIAATPVFENFFERYKNVKLPAIYVYSRYIKATQFILAFIVIVSLTGFITYPFKNKVNFSTETTISIKSNSPGYQVFYAFIDNKFSEENSVKVKTSESLIPEINKLQSIRLDAFLGDGDVWEIESITISNQQATLELNGEKLLHSINRLSGHLETPYLNEDNKISMKVLGHDPYFTLKFDYPLSEFNEIYSINVFSIDDFKEKWKISLIIVALTLIIPLFILIRRQFLSSNSIKVEIPIFNYLFKNIYYFAIIIVVLYILGSLAVSTYNPFIYFRF